MLIFILSGFFVLVLFLWTKREFHNYVLMNKYKTIVDLLNFFLEKAYEVIYNDQIIVFTSEGSTQIPKDQLETIERNFIKMAIEIMGNNNEKLFIEFYNDRTTFISNMLLFFRQRLLKDEIVKIINSKMTK